VTVLVVILFALLGAWLGTLARWRSRAAAREADWRHVQAEMLAEMDRLRDEAERARINAAQAARDTTGWADGYKQGCSDMIRAMAALSRGAVAGEGAPEGGAGEK
jgi:hypothetical protein